MTMQRNLHSRFAPIHLHLPKLFFCLAIYALLINRAAGTYIYTLSDGNSSLRMEAASQSGLSNWTVDGQDILDQDWFWYRSGDSAPEASLETLGWPTVVQHSDSTLKMTYANRQVSVQVTYSLVGGASGSGAANLSEQIKIRNRTGHALDFHFFQYTDLDFSGNTQLGKNLQGSFNEANVIGNSGSIKAVIDTELSPGANHGVAGIDSLPQLNDLLATTLVDYSGPSANAGWTLEWDTMIAPKGTWILSRVVNLVPVPEPSGWAMVTLGLAACWGICKLTKHA